MALPSAVSLSLSIAHTGMPAGDLPSVSPSQVVDCVRQLCEHTTGLELTLCAKDEADRPLQPSGRLYPLFLASTDHETEALPGLLAQLENWLNGVVA